MYNIYNRYYISEIGKFLNADENLGTLSNIQSNNPYNYCMNNPVSSNSIDLEFLKGDTNHKVDSLASNSGYIELGVGNTLRTVVISASDIALFGRYLLAKGVKRSLVRITEKSIIFPQLSGTYKAYRLPARFSQKVTGTIKNYIIQDAKAKTIAIFKRVGKTTLVFFAVNAVFNLIDYDYDSPWDCLIDTVIDTAISLVAYYAAIVIISLFVTPIFGTVAVIFVIGLAVIFDYGIREIFNYEE